MKAASALKIDSSEKSERVCAAINLDWLIACKQRHIFWVGACNCTGQAELIGDLRPIGHCPACGAAIKLVPLLDYREGVWSKITEIPGDTNSDVKFRQHIVCTYPHAGALSPAPGVDGIPPR